MDRHIEFFTELDRPTVHHARTEAGKFQHFVVAHAANEARFGQLAGIGGVDAIHVSIDFALVRIQRSRQRNGGGVASSASERRDVRVFIDSLKTCGDHDLAFVQQRFHPLGRDRMNASLRVRAVGFDSDLTARQADRFVAHRINCHCHQCNTDLLAGRQQHVHFASRRFLVHLTSQFNQPVGVLAHRTDNHDDLMALLPSSNRFSSGRKNFFTVGDAGATKFLNDKSHEFFANRLEYKTHHCNQIFARVKP